MTTLTQALRPRPPAQGGQSKQAGADGPLLRRMRAML